MNIAPGHSVEVLRDIHRREGLYAKQGEQGKVLEVFRPQPTGTEEIKPWYAKVLIDGKVKTFRLTSLKKL